MGRLDGKVALITGGARGMGKSHVRHFVAEGARVVFGDVRDEQGAKVAAGLGEQSCRYTHHDVTSEDDWAAAVALAADAFGRLDGGWTSWSNNAGVLRDRMIFSMSAEEWDLVIRVHLRGHFVTTRFATAYWREGCKAAGRPVYARIVNTSSEAFLLGSSGQPNYAAAKAGIAALTVTTARSCVRYGVRANAICPRARTAMTADLMGLPPSDGVDPLAPEHVAPLVVYLASPAAETINGEVFVVHGGVAAVMDPPTIRAAFHADTPDGIWTLESVHAALSPAFGDAAPAVGFLCEDTITLATETIGFPQPGA